MDGNIKMTLGVVVALVLQSAGGGYWLSQKLATIDVHTQTIAALENRLTETDMANMKRDVQVNSQRTVRNSEKIEDIGEEIRISPTFDTTNAIVQKIYEMEQNFESFVDGVEEAIEDMHDGLEVDWEEVGDND
jgi:outer membrane murein-binding lipoprotein Lpp